MGVSDVSSAQRNPDTAAAGMPRIRWLQLIMGVACMAMIANLQYGWTLFVDPIEAKYHWGRAAIQVAFTLFVLTETWLVPIEAWFVDKYGPRAVLLFGAAMIAIAWAINARADSLALLYIGAIVGGIGAGSIYGTCVGNALKWFPDRRGLAAGCTAAGFGAGAALTVVPISQMIAAGGYERAFLVFGLGQGAVVFLLALFIRPPQTVMVAAKKKLAIPQTSLNVDPAQTLRTPIFWILYVTFVMVAAGGLMAAAQIGPIARDFKIADVPVNLFGVTMAALTFAISLDRILDGFGRPFFGWVSDNIGRENTMFIAFSTAAATLYVLGSYGSNPLVLVLASALFFCVFGEIYSLFPATCTDTFGGKFATTNAGMLYTAKGTASLLVPLASVVADGAGWYTVFVIAMGLNIAAACSAIFVIKPLRARLIARSQGEAGGEVNVVEATT
jgi:OFA family oxalate/formate antiporter-like MFS transporter